MDDQRIKKKNPSFMNVIFIAFLSVFSGSLAAPLIRLVLNDGVSPVWVAGLRMAAMFIIIWPAVFINKSLWMNVWHMTLKELNWITLAGVLLAGHFFTLALAINYTSIFGSVTIFSTQYLFTVIIAALFLREKPGKGVAVGITMSLIGIAVISWSDFNLKGVITGNLFSLISAFFFAAYYVTGRHVRKTVALGAYTIWVNTFCVLLLLIAAFIINQPYKPLNITNIAVFFGLAVFGSLGGHIGINWALKYVKSDVTSMIYLSQPVFASVIAYFLFREQVEWETALGALFILFGIAFYILTQNKLKISSVKNNIYE